MLEIAILDPPGFNDTTDSITVPRIRLKKLNFEEFGKKVRTSGFRFLSEHVNVSSTRGIQRRQQCGTLCFPCRIHGHYSSRSLAVIFSHFSESSLSQHSCSYGIDEKTLALTTMKSKHESTGRRRRAVAAVAAARLRMDENIKRFDISQENP